jgi:hypothetical protein
MDSSLPILQKVKNNVFGEYAYIPRDQAEIIFYICFLMVFTSIYAFIKRQYDLSVLTTVILFTSLNHWSDPQVGIVRNLDVAASWFGFIYVVLRVFFIKRGVSVLFWLFYFVAVSSYIIGRYLFDNGHILYSTISHCILHLCCNVSVILLCV